MLTIEGIIRNHIIEVIKLFLKIPGFSLAWVIFHTHIVDGKPAKFKQHIM